jgi:hypothetical protein
MARRREPGHQPYRKGSGDERGAAKPHDRHAGPIGEPFDQGRDRRNVAEAETDAANETIAEIDDPELMEMNP